MTCTIQVQFVNLRSITLLLPRIKSIFLAFRDQPGWNPGWLTSVVGAAILSSLTRGKDVREAYLECWLSDPVAATEMNIALATSRGPTTSYLYAPFSTRPFSVRLPDISVHKQRGLCHSRLAHCDMPATWVVAHDDFSQTPTKETFEWNALKLRSQIRNPSAHVDRVYVGCSNCGWGRWLSLPARRCSLEEYQGQFYVVARWL